MANEKQPRRNERLHTLVECAMLIAVSAVLCIWPKFKFLPNGGSITVCSMLPLILISYRHGLKWGFLSSFTFALIQTITGFSSPGTGPAAFVIVLLFDYLIAFTVLGVGGIFRGRFSSGRKELLCGAALAIALRFVCHCISGYIVWGEWASWFFENCGEFGASILAKFAGNGLMMIYSIVYNATYMLPELLLTLVVAYFIYPFLQRVDKN